MSIAGFFLKACLGVLAIIYSPVLFVLAIVFVALVIAAIAVAIGGGAALYQMLPSVDWSPLISTSPMMTIAGSIAGADLVMLPYFHSAQDIERFVCMVDSRAKVFPLVESKDSLDDIDKILDVPGIDEIHIGINDLSLDLKKKFMFELLADGTVEELCRKFKKKGIPYGFGGIGRIGKGELPAENIWYPLLFKIGRAHV